MAVCGGGGERNDIVAGGEVGEAVGAGAVAGGRRYRGGEIGRQVEVDVDAGEAGFAAVLDPVGVEVVPHVVADGGGGVEASVDAGVGFTRGQGDGLCATGGGGEHHRGWCSERNDIVAGNQAGEAVGAGAVAGGRRYRGGEVRRQEQVDVDTRQTRLTRILGPVAVEVVPHEVTDRRGGEHPGVQRVDAVTGCDGDGGLSGGGVGVRVGGGGTGSGG